MRAFALLSGRAERDDGPSRASSPDAAWNLAMAEGGAPMTDLALSPSMAQPGGLTPAGRRRRRLPSPRAVRRRYRIVQWSLAAIGGGGGGGFPPAPPAPPPGPRPPPPHGGPRGGGGVGPAGGG